ncbi:hypothetical protein PoB_006222100 [Plakobranchus ocellatus]|uniref:Uncharacterized protein n=1 Tax=Plakobranchus ocellatus TaxID=259542 RepID=A0AAV4CVJ6_9GAST|nr:hypothetical protein PoB_006222100 [Plakobranchus ocellatus]
MATPAASDGTAHPVTAALSANSDWISAIKDLSKECKVVMGRQLRDFIDGEFSFEDPLVTDVLKHCSLTNLVGESSFGDLDHDINRRANSSNLTRTASHFLKRN